MNRLSFTAAVLLKGCHKNEASDAEVKEFSRRIAPYVYSECLAAKACETRGHFMGSFAHLERAHVLGQASTREHVRVHWQMFLWAVRQRQPRELAAQLVRIVGAAVFTAAGLVPEGNTGGRNVSAFRRLPVPPELAHIIESVRAGGPPQ